MYTRGELGGDVMPEDAHPTLPCDSADCFHYFTLPMALNYQRDSYALWRAATAAYDDPDTRAIFDPKAVVRMSDESLAERLLRHRVALQPVRHPAIWKTLCKAIVKLFDGDIRSLFSSTSGDVATILDLVQRRHKRDFPYLSGPKIANYWLFVIEKYTSATLRGRDVLSIAPDTHVIQASIRLGVVPETIHHRTDYREAVSQSWRVVLGGSELVPIDVHTALWLWSRSHFNAPLDS
jgi:hypothetical protein